MGEIPELEPAPPVVVPPLKPRFWTRRTVLVVAAVVTVVVVATILLTRLGPGDPGWRPLIGQAHNHSSTGEAGLQFAQDLKNDGDDDLVIESMRAEVPAGIAVKESGAVPVGLWTEFYWLTPPTLTHLPLKLAEGKQIRLVLRFHVTCPPAVAATRIPWRLFATVTSGSVRQEVEVGSLADIELTPDSLKEFCDA